MKQVLSTIVTIGLLALIVFLWYSKMFGPISFPVRVPVAEVPKVEIQLPKQTPVEKKVEKKVEPTVEQPDPFKGSEPQIIEPQVEPVAEPEARGPIAVIKKAFKRVIPTKKPKIAVSKPAPAKKLVRKHKPSSIFDIFGRFKPAKPSKWDDPIYFNVECTNGVDCKYNRWNP